MLTIPNQSSVPKAYLELDDTGRMKPSPYYDRVVDVMEELVKFTLVVRGREDYPVDRYSERKESEEAFIRQDEPTFYLGQPRAVGKSAIPSLQLRCVMAGRL